MEASKLKREALELELMESEVRAEIDQTPAHLWATIDDLEKRLKKLSDKRRSKWQEYGKAIQLDMFEG